MAIDRLLAKQLFRTVRVCNFSNIREVNLFFSNVSNATQLYAVLWQLLQREKSELVQRLQRY